jgi:hypothetical protein
MLAFEESFRARLLKGVNRDIDSGRHYCEKSVRQSRPRLPIRSLRASSIGSPRFSRAHHDSPGLSDCQYRGPAEAYDLHRSIGVLLLLIVLIRLAYRVTHPPLPLPADIPLVQQLVSLLLEVALPCVRVLPQ